VIIGASKEEEDEEEILFAIKSSRLPEATAHQSWPPNLPRNSKYMWSNIVIFTERLHNIHVTFTFT